MEAGGCPFHTSPSFQSPLSLQHLTPPWVNRSATTRLSPSGLQQNASFPWGGGLQGLTSTSRHPQPQATAPITAASLKGHTAPQHAQVTSQLCVPGAPRPQHTHYHTPTGTPCHMHDHLYTCMYVCILTHTLIHSPANFHSHVLARSVVPVPVGERHRHREKVTPF